MGCHATSNSKYVYDTEKDRAMSPRNVLCNRSNNHMDYITSICCSWEIAPILVYQMLLGNISKNHETNYTF